MNAQQWQQVGVLLEGALALEEPERLAYLQSACADNQQLREEVESLLRSHAQAGEFLERPAANLVGSEGEAQRVFDRLGQRIGVYQLVAPLGHGGMADVYRAARVDGQYDKHVAIKIVHSGWYSPLVIERFRQERQILASLENPNIARLYDGGTTEDGVPYLVEELVEGLPIDQYCDAQGLALERRLELFAQVCKAVQFAHQRLVIHRDIKPSNILIAPGGIPKLVDFGIAKILETGTAALATGIIMMTPEYASPEQVRGDPITTATDIYSLGMVLYRLITGQSPYPSTANPDLPHLIREGEPIAPSGRLRAMGRPVSPRWRARDLDNIVLKALRKDAGRRYATAEQLANDIERFLGGAPVNATPDSLGYRLHAFARRHTLGMATAGLIALTVIAGVAATLYEGRVAKANERRAVARFNDVHRLANSLIFELHDSIRDLPGATPARKLLVDRALQYLDSLSRDVGGDATLQRDLAAAYQRVGDVQGKPFEANLGDTTGAELSYRRALELRQTLYAQHKGNANDALGLAQALRLHADTLSMISSIQQATLQARQAVATLEPIARVHDKDPVFVEELCADYQDLAGILGGNLNSASMREQSEALTALQNELATARRLVALEPDNRRYQSALLVAEETLGDQLLLAGQVREATVSYSRGLTQLLARAGAATGRQDQQRLHGAYTRSEFVQLWGHDAAAATATNRAALDLAIKMMRADPKDAYARLNVATDLANMADSLSQLKQFSAARADAKRAIDSMAELLKGDPKNSELRGTSGLVLYTAGEVERRSGNNSAALRLFRASLATFEALSAEDPANADAGQHAAALWAKIADTLAATGSLDQARDAYERSLALAAKGGVASQSEDARYTMAGADAGLASMALLAANRLGPRAATRPVKRAAACEFYRRSARLWATIKEPGALSPSGFYTAVPQQLQQQRVECGG